MRVLFVTALVMALAGCRNARTDSPLDAAGDTPIRYVVCNQLSADCDVYARFDKLDTCERHKKLSGFVTNCPSQVR
jgi:hypothetical protein